MIKEDALSSEYCIVFLAVEKVKLIYYNEVLLCFKGQPASQTARQPDRQTDRQTDSQTHV